MRPFLSVIALAFVTTSGHAQEAMTIETVFRVKDATVFLRANVDAGEDGVSASGSGFVIQVDGTTAYIVTNDHVVRARPGNRAVAGRTTMQVVFRSGTKAESKTQGEVVAASPERDLALIRVSGVANLPRPLEVATDPDPAPFETMPVYIFGFPFGDQLAVGKGNPPVNVGRGQVSSIRRGEDDRLSSVLLDGALNPGNSGGPVVDSKGRLVGIARATIPGANIGFAIAVPELLAMLDGSAEEPRFKVETLADGTVAVDVDVPLLDPLKRITSARLLHTSGSAKFDRRKRSEPPRFRPGPDEEERERDARTGFIYGAIERAESLPLTLGKGRATGRLILTPAGRDVVFWSQVTLVDGSGRSVHAKPGRCFFNVLPPNEGEGKSRIVRFWGEAVDPDDDCSMAMDGGDLAIEIPGTLHDLNKDIEKNNAPRVVREVEGDFVATVKVTGSFQPGPVRTGPKSVPYNGGGLIAWLDEENYIRLERASMYRNNRVVGFLAFESREHGTRASVHNKGGLDPRQDLWLRLERRGARIKGFLSTNGQDWDELEPIDVEWPARLKVGVAAVNSCGGPMTVRFQEYSIEK